MKPETFAIVLKETGNLIGCIGLNFHSDLAKKDDEAELGYWLGVPWWGKGFMPEAGREMLRHAFEDLHLERVCLHLKRVCLYLHILLLHHGLLLFPLLQ